MIHGAGGSCTIPWQNIKQVIKTSNAMPFGMGGLFGLLLFQLVGGSKQLILLELNDATRHVVPPFLADAEALFEAVSRQKR